MKKETILTIVVCVLVVVSFIGGMFTEGVVDLFEREVDRGVPSVILYECENGTATWFTTTILYGTENTVYPDSYRISFSIVNKTTGETVDYNYTYCELRR